MERYTAQINRGMKHQMQCEKCGHKLKAYKERQYVINRSPHIVVFCDNCDYYETFPLEKAGEIIPKGSYCYSKYHIEEDKRNKNGWPTMVLDDLCPFWYRLPEMPKQAHGYCAYLLCGDWEEPMGLLWDQCKECQVNDDDDDEEAEKDGE